MDEIIRSYEEKKFGCWGDYLRWYLCQDVRLLLGIATELADGYYSMLGINLVDSAKYSISSLAQCGSQHHLIRARRIGQFSPNNVELYGYTCTHKFERNCCGGGGDLR